MPVFLILTLLILIYFHLLQQINGVSQISSSNASIKPFNFSKNKHHRHLSFNSSQSEVTGNGTVAFNAQEIVMITVTSKDSSGNLITTGGEILLLELDIYYSSSGSTTSINTQLEDNNDGTYQYEYMALDQGSA